MLTIHCKAQTEVDVLADTISISDFDAIAAPEKMFISTPAEYDKLNHFRNYDSTPLAEIDFEKKILIGYKTYASGCREPKFSVAIKMKGDMYTAYLIVYTKGICRLLHRKICWFVMDKPTANFQMEFKTSFEYSN